MRSLLIAILLGLPALIFGQGIRNADNIPTELKQRANAVILSEDVILQVKDVDMLLYREKKTITILNANGEDEARIVISYSKGTTVKSIKGAIYDRMGMVTRKISEKDFRDESASDGSLFEDSRIKYFLPTSLAYPYTVEYEYELQEKQTLLLPGWHPVPSPGTSLERSTYTLVAAPGVKIRYKESKLPQAGKISTDAKGSTTYVWSMSNFKALRAEPYSPDFQSLTPCLRVAAENFVYDGVAGTFTSWEEYGKWTSEKLLKDQDQLSPETTDRMKKLAEGERDQKRLAKKIYEYMQQKTRYVSVQIGIGGFKPISAAEVDKTGYGDCKGLVNYTRALLKAAGIESWYVTVKAGPLKMSALPDFASMDQFNHAILCMPFTGDTLWVDCTSKTLPFGFLSSFTDDRLVVACTPEGGKVLRTPSWKAELNRQVRKANFRVNESGSLSGEMTTKFSGLQYDNRDVLKELATTEQVKQIKDFYNINNLDVLSYKLSEEKSLTPMTTETLALEAREYWSPADGRFYLPLNLINVSKPLQEISRRVNPVYIRRGYYDLDETTYTLPAGFKVETVPERIDMVQPFGEYHAGVAIKEGVAMYTRTMILREGVYSPEAYEDLVNFFQKAADADELRITLVKKEPAAPRLTSGR